MMVSLSVCVGGTGVLVERYGLRHPSHVQMVDFRCAAIRSRVTASTSDLLGIAPRPDCAVDTVVKPRILLQPPLDAMGDPPAAKFTAKRPSGCRQSLHAAQKGCIAAWLVRIVAVRLGLKNGQQTRIKKAFMRWVQQIVRKAAGNIGMPIA